MKTDYRIVRKFFTGDDEIIAEKVTLEEAQEHCKSPETSSRTCSTLDGLQRTREHGAWFDVYERVK